MRVKECVVRQTADHEQQAAAASLEKVGHTDTQVDRGWKHEVKKSPLRDVHETHQALLYMADRAGGQPTSD